MLNIIKLLIAEWFGAKDAKLNGSNLFSNEYTTSQQYAGVSRLFGKGESPLLRIPIQGNTIQQFLQASRMAYSNGIEIIALLDSYESDSSMMNRLNTIKNSASYIPYIELFNELPHMNDLYPGEKINSLQELLEKTNRYSDWIHQNIKGTKVITMAPYNSMDQRSWGVWDNVTNTRILKDLILYTTADIAAIHLYGDSCSKKLQLVELGDNIDEWNDEAAYKKKIWVTECGEDGWKSHVKYYEKMVKLFRNLVNIEKIIWYRQTTKTATEMDNGYALEIIESSQKSPLYNELIV